MLKQSPKIRTGVRQLPPVIREQIEKLKAQLPPGVTLDINIDYAGKRAARLKRE